MNRRDFTFGALLALAALTVVACSTSAADVQAGRPLRSQIIGGHYDTVALCILEQLDATGRVWLMGASFVDDQATQRARISKRSAIPAPGPRAVTGWVDPWEAEVFSGPQRDWEIEVAQAGANVEILTRSSIEGGTDSQSSFLQDAIDRCAESQPAPPPK